MVKIFIIYGKPEGEKYASYIDKYFKQNGLGSFLASPKSPDLKAGEDFQKRIDVELDNADIVIVVVTAGLKRSIAAMDEIKRVLGMTIPIIPYVKNKTQSPDELIKTHVVTFGKKNVNRKAKMNELELTMWRVLDAHVKKTDATPEQYQPQPQTYRPMEVKI